MTGFDKLKRFAVITVNSLSQPDTDWGEHESPPGAVSIVLKVSGISIDRYSFEQIDLLHDYVRRVEQATQRDPSLPAIQFFCIDVSFDAITDPAERRYFMDLPTSFSLTDEQVDRLRKIGGRLLRQSPEFQRMLQAPLDR